MKQFSLKEYLEHPDRKVVTREGYPVRILCTDLDDDDYPVAAAIGNIDPIVFTPNGQFQFGVETKYDLFFAPEKHEGWTFFTKSFGIRYIESIICATREEAQRMREADPGRYGAIVKLEWEE